MADPDVSSRKNTVGASTQSDDCAICLELLLHPLKLLCGHTFCFLCIKGATRCPLCRSEIATDYFDKPPKVVAIKCPNGSLATDVASGQDFQWFYEGRNGWWAFDERSCSDIEMAFTARKPFTEIMIVGQIYVIDFTAMKQFRKNEPLKKRCIKRDTSAAQKKGIAGLLVATDSPSPAVSQSSKSSGNRSLSSGEKIDIVINDVVSNRCNTSNNSDEVTTASMVRVASLKLSD